MPASPPLKSVNENRVKMVFNVPICSINPSIIPDYYLNPDENLSSFAKPYTELY